MATCELCGSNSPKLVKIRVAGTIMRACPNCKDTGDIVDEPQKTYSHTFNRRRHEHSEKVVTPDYSKILQKGLRKSGLTVHALAEAVNIKESTLTKYVQGKIKPDVKNAQKLENYLDVPFLVEGTSSYDVDDYLDDNESSSGMTLGDLIKK